MPGKQAKILAADQIDNLLLSLDKATPISAGENAPINCKHFYNLLSSSLRRRIEHVHTGLATSRSAKKITSVICIRRSCGMPREQHDWFIRRVARCEMSNCSPVRCSLRFGEAVPTTTRCAQLSDCTRLCQPRHPNAPDTTKFNVVELSCGLGRHDSRCVSVGT
jgi:hypothetical protein